MRSKSMDLIKNHATQEERAAFSNAMIEGDLDTTSAILTQIRKRLREAESQGKRCEKAVAKLVEKFGRQSVSDALGAVLATSSPVSVDTF